MIKGLGIAGLVTVVGIAGFVALRPTPCERVAHRICELMPEAECRSFRKTVTEFVAQEKCVEALAGLDFADAMPGNLRTVAMTQVVTEMMGLWPDVEARLKEAARVTADPLAQLARTGTLSDSAKQTLIAAPPEACLVLLTKMGNGQGFTQQPLHEVLVATNQGVDLGSEVEDWAEWCQRRARVRPEYR